MKKILLATTALAAVSIATPAFAEASLSAYYEFGYNTTAETDVLNDKDGLHTDSEVHIKFSETSDSGLTYSAAFEIEGAADDGGTGNNLDEASMTLSTPEFGAVTVGQNDDAADQFQTWLPGGRNLTVSDDAPSSIGVNFDAAAEAEDNTTDEYSLQLFPNNASYGDAAKVTYISPGVNGFKFGGSYAKDQDNENAQTSFGIKYDTEFYGVGLTGTAASRSDGDNVSSSSYGITANYAGLTVAVSIANLEDDGLDVKDFSGQGDAFRNYDVSTEQSILGVGIGYAVSDAVSLSAGWVQSEAEVTEGNAVTEYEGEATSLGLSYTVAPGLNFALGVNNLENTSAAGVAGSGDSIENVRATIQANF